MKKDEGVIVEGSLISEGSSSNRDGADDIADEYMPTSSVQKHINKGGDRTFSSSLTTRSLKERLFNKKITIDAQSLQMNGDSPSSIGNEYFNLLGGGGTL